jgi:hypothetical protein
VGAALDATIDEVLETMSDEQRAEPRFFSDNYPAWNEFFLRRYEWELAAYDGPPPPPACNNAVGRRRWWIAPGRTLENMLVHIKGGNYPVLGMSPPPSLSRRRGSSWMPRWMASRSSGSASSRSASRSASLSSASTLRTVKKQPPSAPPTRGRSSGALVIREGARTSSPPARGRKQKPRKDAATAAAFDLAAAEAARAEDAALREAIARSLEDLVPADNSMPTDATLAWSRQDWEREEVDAGQGSSRWAPGQSSQQAPPPQDGGDSSDDDGGDYTAFYRYLGM